MTNDILDATTTTARRAKRAPVEIPRDFPHPQRFSGTPLFEAVLGIAPSTFALKLGDGKIPAPTTRIGRLSKWPESLMAKTRDSGVA
jgi:hypothetical protein